jgi:hypothetical protein
MIELEYNILWLDDDFLPAEIDHPVVDEALTREGFLEDVELASDYGLKVDGVANYEEFCSKLNNLSSYQAVIFDLKGLEANSEINDGVMQDSFEKVKNELPVYIYSANLDSETFRLPIKQLKKSGHCFNKALDVCLLYEKVREELDNNLHFYVGRGECLSLFTNGYLSSSNRTKMDDLLKEYSKNNDEISYNNIRQILEDLLDTLVNIGTIPNNEDTNSLNKKVKYLTGTVSESVYSYKPNVPYEICRQEIRCAIKYLADICNYYSHNSKVKAEYLIDGENLKEYNLLLKQSVFPAFFAVMKWFYGYMESL